MYKNGCFFIVFFIALQPANADVSYNDAQRIFVERFSDHTPPPQVLDSITRIAERVFPEERLPYPEDYMNSYLEYYELKWDKWGKHFQPLSPTDRKIVEEQISDMIQASCQEIERHLQAVKDIQDLPNILEQSSQKKIKALCEEIDNPFSPVFKTPLSQSALDVLKAENITMIAERLTEEKINRVCSPFNREPRATRTSKVYGVDRINRIPVEDFDLADEEEIARRISEGRSKQKAARIASYLGSVMCQWTMSIGKEAGMYEIPVEISQRRSAATKEYIARLRKQRRLDTKLRAEQKLKDGRLRGQLSRLKEYTEAAIRDSLEEITDIEIEKSESASAVDSIPNADRSDSNDIGGRYLEPRETNIPTELPMSSSIRGILAHPMVSKTVIVVVIVAFVGLAFLLIVNIRKAKVFKKEKG